MEVRDRLKTMDLSSEEREEILSDLISEDWVNEERFARSAVRGKFRMKSWGRRKIRAWLKAKQVSDFCMEKGFEEIDESEYRQRMMALIENKWSSLPAGLLAQKRKARTYDYMVQKGYEPNLVWEALQEIASS